MAKTKKVYIKVPKTKDKKAEARAKKSISNYGEFVEGWENQLKAVFDTSSLEFTKMMTIIKNSKKMKLGHRGNHDHHIVPRSYYKKYNKPVDNSDKNLVTLTPVEHYIVHYYAWKCANKVMKTSMAYAFRMMYALAGKNVSEQNVTYFAKAYSDAWSEKNITVGLEELKDRYSNCLYEPIKLTKEYMTFRCRQCGNIRKVKKDNHYFYPISTMQNCRACYRTENFTNAKFALLFIIGQDDHAYWKTINLERYMVDGKISYKHAATCAIHDTEGCKTYKKVSFIKLLHEDLALNERHISNCGRTFMEGGRKMLEGFKWLLENHLEPQTFLGHSKQNLIRALKKNKMVDKDFEPGNNIYKPVSLYEFRNLGFHLKSEWEEILGISWYLIEENYTVIYQSMNILDFFMKDCKDWRAGVKALVEILEYMEKYNTDNPNWSFDDANNRAWPVE